MIGLAQPLADAVKLFLKEIVLPKIRNVWLFFIAPCIGLTISLWLWLNTPARGSGGTELGILIIFTIISLGVYPLFLAGWASNRKFGQLGALRAIAQTISYEIRLALVLFRVLALEHTLRNSWRLINRAQHFSLVRPLIIVWAITCVAETNRTPFDFSEGESELVSGFNVEFGARAFAVIFIAEYAIILFFRSLTIILFFKAANRQLIWSAGAVGVSGIWIWLRSTFPRYRYDKLLNLAWKRLLPQAIGIAVGYSSLTFLN